MWDSQLCPVKRASSGLKASFCAWSRCTRNGSDSVAFKSTVHQSCHVSLPYKCHGNASFMPEILIQNLYANENYSVPLFLFRARFSLLFFMDSLSLRSAFVAVRRCTPWNELRLVAKSGTRAASAVASAMWSLSENVFLSTCLLVNKLPWLITIYPIKHVFISLNSYKQADQQLYCGKHYQEMVLAKNTQTPAM